MKLNYRGIEIEIEPAGKPVCAESCADDSEFTGALNARALDIYQAAVAAAPEAEYIELAVAACEKAADEVNGRHVGHSGRPDDGCQCDAIIFIDANGRGLAVNLWTAASSQHATRGGFEGIGFDMQLDWSEEEGI
jgi:hypothetical protein